jgi:hypothetical protein
MASPGAFVSQRDYRDFNGFGTSDPDEIANLRKALSAGSDIVNPGAVAGGMFPLRPQSLEATLKNVTFEMDEIKLFKTIPKVPAVNTVEEFNRLLAYSSGGARAFDLGWMPEGDLPEEEDSTYERVAVLIKFLGVVGRVTHVANTVRSAHGNAIALETQNKTMYMLQQLEHSLMFGDSSLVPQQADGLLALITAGAPNNVVDLRGGILSEEKMNDMLLMIRDNLGHATDYYGGTGSFADLAKQAYDRQRGSFAAGQPGMLGAQITAFQGQHGKVNLHDSIFIQPGAAPTAAGLGNVNRRPLAPTISSQPANAPNAASLFVTADGGTYTYKVVGRNRFGASAPTTTSSTTVNAGDRVQLTVGDGGQGTTYYEVYRSDKTGTASTAKLMAKVARTGATQVISDLNADIPGTSTGFMLMQNPQSFSWAQLLPMTRLPLAAIDTSIRWAQVIYGAIKMYTPGKNVIVKNVGRAAASLPQT